MTNETEAKTYRSLPEGWCVIELGPIIRIIQKSEWEWGWLKHHEFDSGPYVIAPEDVVKAAWVIYRLKKDEYARFYGA